MSNDLIDFLAPEGTTVKGDLATNQLVTREDLLGGDVKNPKRHLRFTDAVKEKLLGDIDTSLSHLHGRYVNMEVVTVEGKAPAPNWTIENVKSAENRTKELVSIRMRVGNRNVEIVPGQTKIKKVKALEAKGVIERLRDAVETNKGGLFDRAMETAHADRKARKGGKEYNKKYDRYFNKEELAKWEAYIKEGIITAQD
jgi:hypothetical protein